MSARDVLFQPCDVLIPAAIENQITEHNAHQVQAKILCEGANGPTTWQADAIIDSKGIFTVPDILGQRRRRHRQLFRVGAGPPGIFLARERSQRAPL